MRPTTIILCIVVFIVLFTTCINNTAPEKSNTKNTSSTTQQDFHAQQILYSEYAGSSACAHCHNDIYNKHIHTNHFLSSKPGGTEKNIRGSFEKGKNVFTYNPDLKVSMEKRDSGLFQVVYYRDEEKIALRFDITVGSGNKGQSYMHWQGDSLFQLPITYYSVAEKWANSPGFPNKVQYQRPITSRCMECHTTYAGILSPPGKEPEAFDRNKIIYGVDCEKCHGPGAAHVEFQSENPDQKTARYIINPENFTRQQKLDLCTWCHGGRLEKKQPSFTYLPGDSLADYFLTDNVHSPLSILQPDVHGNQYGLMSASKCFIKSQTLTCNTCHNTHENERGKLARFSEKCMGCHTGKHKQIPQLDARNMLAIKNNCIDCHMPESSSRAIVLYTSGQEAPIAAKFRSHFISVYPEAVNEFLKELRK